MIKLVIKSIFLFIVLFSSVFAKPIEQILVVQDCLLSSNFKYDEMAAVKDLRLIKTTQLKDFHAARTKRPLVCRGFINVTDAWRAFKDDKNPQQNAVHFLQKYFPKDNPNDFLSGYQIKFQSQVRALFQKIELVKMLKNLKTLTHFPNRYVHSKQGLIAASMLSQQLKDLALSRDDVEINSVATIHNGKQPSLILKIGKHLNNPGVVMGAHFDTLDNTRKENKPGADDNASGTVTLLETARILLNSDVQFKKPIYLIWYAGEEEGMLGAQSVVQYFNANHIPVEAVLHLDGTGFIGSEEVGIGLTDDATDAGLTVFLADLVSTYLKLPVGAVRCGYACSDHVIWSQNGNRVAFPCTTMNDEGNPYVHTAQDTIDKLSLKHISDFVKLSIAFAVELALN